MITFEGYERRIDKINAVLAEHGINGLEDAKRICDEAGVDAAGIVRGEDCVDLRLKRYR